MTTPRDDDDRSDGRERCAAGGRRAAREIDVTPDLALVGVRLGDKPAPKGMLVTTVVRDHRAMIPNADTVFAAGDFLVLAVDRDQGRVADGTAWARGETAPDPDSAVP